MNLDVRRGKRGRERSCADAGAGDGISWRQKHNGRALSVPEGRQGAIAARNGEQGWREGVSGTRCLVQEGHVRICASDFGPTERFDINRKMIYDNYFYKFASTDRALR